MSNLAATLPLLCFLLLFVVLRQRAVSQHQEDWRTTWLSASVLWGVVVVGVTELLNLVGLPFSTSIFPAWALLALILTVWTLLIFRRSARRDARRADGTGGGRWRPDSTVDAVLFLGVAVMTLVLGFVAVTAPPNTWDSMTYHMSRVAHWMQNGSLEHFPTANSRQLFAWPWPEFAILQFQALAGSDRWANLIQWMAMVGCLIGTSIIAKQLGGLASTQVVTAVVVSAIPTGILQATSTQTDYVAAFWLVCFVHYSFLLTDHTSSRRDGVIVILAGASLGLAALTKGTSYAIGAPFIVLLLLWNARGFTFRSLRPLVIMALVALSLILGHHLRNYRTFGHPIAPDRYRLGFANELWSPAAVTSIAVKNIALHLSTPSHRVNAAAVGTISWLHGVIGLDVNDARTSVSPPPFDIDRPRPHEDVVGNPLHVVLLAVAIVMMLIPHRDEHASRRAAHALALLTGFVLFSLLLKWQPWGSRLQLPLFVLGAPLIAITLMRLLRPWLAAAVALFMLIASVPWLVFNESRPLIPRSIGGLLESVEARTVLDTPREDLYFRNFPALATPYRAAVTRIQQTRCRDVGLILGEDDWEYPFWVLFDTAGANSVRLSHLVSVDQVTVLSPISLHQSAKPCAVIALDDGDADAVRALEDLYDERWHMTSVTVFTHRSPGR